MDFSFWSVFLFSHIFGCFLCVFFSCKSSHAIHSFDLEAVFFFCRWKKKYCRYFIHSIDFAPKCEKNELLQENKNTIPFPLPKVFFAFHIFRQKSKNKSGGIQNNEKSDFLTKNQKLLDCT